MTLDEHINAVKEVVEDMDKMETVITESTVIILNRVVESIDWEGKELIIDFHHFHETIRYNGYGIRLFDHWDWKNVPKNCFEFTKYSIKIITPEERTEVINKLWPVFQTLVDLRLATNNYHFGIPENIYINCRRIKW